jgi:hypothetical protein
MLHEKNKPKAKEKLPVRFYALSIDSSFHLEVMKIKLNNYFALL